MFDCFILFYNGFVIAPLVHLWFRICSICDNHWKKVIKTINHARKSLLFDKDNVWVTKDNCEFDVTMGSYDGAELCELVGLYLLDLLTKEIGKQKIGLYREDGFSCFENISGPDSEKIKTKLFKIFKSNGLSIAVEFNLIVTNFLDVTFDL